MNGTNSLTLFENPEIIGVACGALLVSALVVYVHGHLTRPEGPTPSEDLGENQR